MWNKIELFRIKMNETECSRTVPIRNVPLHRKTYRRFNGVSGCLWSLSSVRYVAVIGSFFSIDCNFDPYPSGFIGQV